MKLFDFRRCVLALFLLLPLSLNALAQEAAEAVCTTVACPDLARKVVPARKIVVPDVEGFKVLKGDFHSHTIFSDGNVWPTERIVEAVENGFDAIAVTDHIEYRPKLGSENLKLADNNDFNISNRLASAEAAKRKIIFVPGTEITKRTMPPGHLNALFVTDVNPIAAEVEDYRKMIDVAVSQGAFILWNHPGWQSKSGGIEKGAPILIHPPHKELIQAGKLHGIEVFNGREYYPIVSDWAEQYDLAIFANSDIHPTEWKQYGVQNPNRPVTLVLAREKTLESLKEGFFAKRTIAWANGMVWGREKWLKPLFAACIDIKRDGDTMVATNKSSIPCLFRMGNATGEIQLGGEVKWKADPSEKKLQVVNWMIGWNKPLEITLP